MRCSVTSCIHYGDCDFDLMDDVEQGSDCSYYKNKFTEDDIDECWPYHKTYFLEVLNGEKSIDEAREDLASLIDSKYDPRIIKAKALSEQIKENRRKLELKDSHVTSTKGRK